MYVGFQMSLILQNNLCLWKNDKQKQSKKIDINPAWVLVYVKQTIKWTGRKEWGNNTINLLNC